MAALDIRPHSRRLSTLAVAGLAVLAIGGFAEGLGRQIAAASGPSPFPPPQEKSLRIAVAKSVAPAAPQPVAAPPRHVTPPAPDDAAEAAPEPPATDVSTVVADPPQTDPPAPADPQPADEPPTF
jgi:hypothetical protein